MSDPFVGEIRVFAGNFAPKGWALCNGQLLPITQNTALFSLLGVTYGGDGKTNFALPNLMGRAPMQPGTGPGLTPHVLGETSGSQTVTLLTTEMPAHNHVPLGNGTAGSGVSSIATDTVWGSGGRSGTPVYTDDPSRVTMSPVALGGAGGSSPHNNMQPYLGLNYIIALQGIFPQRP
jgi:microcystin-dependent protein